MLKTAFFPISKLTSTRKTMLKTYFLRSKLISMRRKTQNLFFSSKLFSVREKKPKTCFFLTSKLTSKREKCPKLISREKWQKLFSQKIEINYDLEKVLKTVFFGVASIKTYFRRELMLEICFFSYQNLSNF